MFNSIDSSSRTMAMFIGLPVAAVISGYLIIADQIPASPATPPFSDYRSEKPGVQHHITPGRPAGAVCDRRGRTMLPKVVPRPDGAMPQALPGYTVSLYSSELDAPRLIRAAPNGDLFVAETGREPRARAPRRRRDRQGPGSGSVRGRAQSSVRHRLLPARPQPAIRLCRQHGFDRPLPVPDRAT